MTFMKQKHKIGVSAGIDPAIRIDAVHLQILSSWPHEIFDRNWGPVLQFYSNYRLREYTGNWRLQFHDNEFCQIHTMFSREIFFCSDKTLNVHHCKNVSKMTFWPGVFPWEWIVDLNVFVKVQYQNGYDSFDKLFNSAAIGCGHYRNGSCVYCEHWNKNCSVNFIHQTVLETEWPLFVVDIVDIIRFELKIETFR